MFLFLRTLKGRYTTSLFIFVHLNTLWIPSSYLFSLLNSLLPYMMTFQSSPYYFPFFFLQGDEALRSYLLHFLFLLHVTYLYFYHAQGTRGKLNFMNGSPFFSGVSLLNTLGRLFHFPFILVALYPPIQD